MNYDNISCKIGTIVNKINVSKKTIFVRNMMGQRIGLLVNPLNGNIEKRDIVK